MKWEKLTFFIFIALHQACGIQAELNPTFTMPRLERNMYYDHFDIGEEEDIVKEVERPIPNIVNSFENPFAHRVRKHGNMAKIVRKEEFVEPYPISEEGPIMEEVKDVEYFVKRTPGGGSRARKRERRQAQNGGGGPQAKSGSKMKTALMVGGGVAAGAVAMNMYKNSGSGGGGGGAGAGAGEGAGAEGPPPAKRDTIMRYETERQLKEPFEKPWYEDDCNYPLVHSNRMESVRQNREGECVAMGRCDVALGRKFEEEHFEPYPNEEYPIQEENEEIEEYFDEETSLPLNERAELHELSSSTAIVPHKGHQITTVKPKAKPSRFPGGRAGETLAVVGGVAVASGAVAGAVHLVKNRLRDRSMEEYNVESESTLVKRGPAGTGGRGGTGTGRGNGGPSGRSRSAAPAAGTPRQAGAGAGAGRGAGAGGGGGGNKKGPPAVAAAGGGGGHKKAPPAAAPAGTGGNKGARAPKRG